MGMVMITLATLLPPVFHDTLRVGRIFGVEGGTRIQSNLRTCTSSNPARCLEVVVTGDSTLPGVLPGVGRDLRPALQKFRDRVIQQMQKRGFTLIQAGPLPDLDFSFAPRPVNLSAFGGFEYPVEASQGTIYVATYYSDTARDTIWPWTTTVTLQLHPVQDTLACFSSPYGYFCIHYFGHSHQEDPANLRDKPVGAFIPSSGDPTPSVAISTFREPGCSAYCRAVGATFYRAPEVAGIVKLTADATDLHVELYGYVGLFLGGDVSQVSHAAYPVGGTCRHFGNLSPWKAGRGNDWDPRCGMTDLNHGLLVEVVPLFDHILYLLADSLGWLTMEVDSATQACYLRPQWLFPINDASLPWGGMFDICGTWNVKDGCSLAPHGGHRSHRTGRTVDLSTAYRISYTTRQYVPNTPEIKKAIYRKLVNIANLPESPVYGCFALTEEGNHIHLWLHPLGLAGRLDSTLVRAQEGSTCFQWVPWEC